MIRLNLKYEKEGFHVSTLLLLLKFFYISSISPKINYVKLIFVKWRYFIKNFLIPRHVFCLIRSKKIESAA